MQEGRGSSRSAKSNALKLKSREKSKAAGGKLDTMPVVEAVVKAAFAEGERARKSSLVITAGVVVVNQG